MSGQQQLNSELADWINEYFQCAWRPSTGKFETRCWGWMSRSPLMPSAYPLFLGLSHGLLPRPRAMPPFSHPRFLPHRRLPSLSLSQLSAHLLFCLPLLIALFLLLRAVRTPLPFPPCPSCCPSSSSSCLLLLIKELFYHSLPHSHSVRNQTFTPQLNIPQIWKTRKSCSRTGNSAIHVQRPRK